jgi:hypothetical protein
MREKDHHYTSYILRLWQVSNDEQPVWHASLEDPLSGQRTAFATLDDLCAFLKDETTVSRHATKDDRGCESLSPR